MGDQLRITVELLDTERAEVLSAKRYEGRLADMFKLHDEIACDATGFVTGQLCNDTRNG